jgi:ABC-type sugar transport system permease subunit
LLGLVLGKFGALRPFPGRRLVRALIILPRAVLIALATVAWDWMFDSLYSVIADIARQVPFFGAVAFFVILSAFPFYWMLITSFKTNSDLYSVANIPFWFNEAPTLAHFRHLFEHTLLVHWLLNSSWAPASS